MTRASFFPSRQAKVLRRPKAVKRKSYKLQIHTILACIQEPLMNSSTFFEFIIYWSVPKARLARRWSRACVITNTLVVQYDVYKHKRFLLRSERLMYTIYSK